MRPPNNVMSWAMSWLTSPRIVVVLLFPGLVAFHPVFAQTTVESGDDSGDAVQQSIRYYKGKSPGGNNSYFARYDEDYSYLKDPSLSKDFFDPLKFIPLNDARDIYVTLNGESRFRFDDTEFMNFSVSPAALSARTAGGAPRLTLSPPSAGSVLLKERYELGLDLHIGDQVRFYGELRHGEQNGQRAGSIVVASQRNELELVNGFAEFDQSFGDARTGVRVGRQQLFLGNGHNVGINIATNLPDPVLDGVRTFSDWGKVRFDAFAFNAVKYIDGVVAGVNNAHRNLWGGYGSVDLPPARIFDLPLTPSIDAYYLGFRTGRDNSGVGTGLYNDRALATGTTVSPGSGFITGQDQRQTFGLRWYGALGPWHFDDDAAIQVGQFAGWNVEAWAFNTDTEFTIAALPGQPEIGVHIDAASGGADRAHHTLATYQPILSNTYYYLPNSFFSPTNFYDISPRLRFSPMPSLSAEFFWAFLWRYSQGDAVYGGNWQGGGVNNLAVTALTRGRVIGNMPDLTLTWHPVPHITVRGIAAVLLPGSALTAASGRDTWYFDSQVSFQF
ncbi:MAG: alginate export family protein [Azospirillaceae bacterium]|nr:alginate export family protein [Azospirillaceae bacterium]